MNGLQSLETWRSAFNNPSGGMLGLLNAIQVSDSYHQSRLHLPRAYNYSQNIGALAAYPFAPYLSDGVGRRPAVFIGAVIMCGATAIQTASQSVGMFIGARQVFNTRDQK